jgi:hypothetical protein
MTISDEATTATVDSPAGSTPAVEVRVHGIGDHDDMSALGSPTVVLPGNRVVVATPPTIPAHPMRLVNWSRTSRGASRGLLWYLAFPFTLVNTVGNMGPAGQGGRWLRAATSVVSVLLSIAAAMWLIVIVETVLKVVPLPGSGAWAGPATASLVPIGIAIWMVVRARTHAPVRARAWVHAAALVVAGVVAVWLPAQRAFSGWPSILTPVRGSSGVVVERLDATTVIVIATTALTVLLSAGVMFVRRYVPDPVVRSSLAMASLLLVMAMALMHTISSLLRMAVGWLSYWVSPLRGDDPRVLNYEERALMPYQSDVGPAAPRLDLIPLYGLGAVISLAIVARLVFRYWPGGPGPIPARDETNAPRARWVHDLVTSAPALLGPVCVGSAVVGLAVTGVLTVAVDELMTGWRGYVVVRLIHVLTATVVLVVLLRAVPRVRATMSLVADLAGFWPVEYHPLAGVSYREATLGGISAAIAQSGAKRAVLVGHSQGSVLCAWWVRHRSSGQQAKVDLVTCGSPLASLYARFFPRHIDADFFTQTRDGARTWRNFWRDTDPIATALPIAHNTQLTDPRDGGRVQAHGNYWTDPDQTTWIAGRVAGLPAS